MNSPGADDDFAALQQQWIPAETLNDDTILPSFLDIKKKTMRDLYGVDGNDKSPKGSVDTLIQPLVNLLNVHSCFATLSSCSGRIALFDPHMKQPEDSNDEIREDPFEESNGDDIERSGKGHGAWLLASHEQVEPWTLVSLLDETITGDALRETLIFKHEPLLLHVAASSLTYGRQLLSLALQLGFRESGLIVTQHRVTVAIRSHSLALCVPLARQGPLRPSPAFLEALVKEANVRIQSNQEKLERLYQMVQDVLFRPATPAAVKVLCAQESELPRLNLWGHAAVAVPVSGTVDDVNVFVFGGYGEGPELEEGSTPSARGKRCCRSNCVYSIRRRDGMFDDYWREIRQIPMAEENTETLIMSCIGVEILEVYFTPRESLDACILPTSDFANKPLVAIYGGRASPSKPFGDLLLYYPLNADALFMKPTDIRGQSPAPRWGHTFTALSGNDGLMAVLVGGRNETTTFGSLHILTLIESNSDANHFHWASLDLGLPPRFHHTTVTVDDSVFVFGGLSDTNDLLSTFQSTKSSTTTTQPAISGFHVDSQGVALFDEQDVGGGTMINLSGCIGGASCLVRAPDVSGDTKTLIALTGGVSPNDSPTVQWCEVVSADEELALIPRDDITIEPTAGTVDFGSMVHHCCVSLPGTSEFVLVGGGVSSFAFGPSFAE